MPRTLRLFAPPKRIIGPLLFVLVLVVIILPILLSIGWVLAQTVITRTSGVEFCASCHSMKPMAASYRLDIHGGHNVNGVQAICSDCHLPQDNSANLIWVYWKRLMGDAWVELFHGSGATNWESLRDARESYVYDSGCISCHANLLGAFPRNPDALAAHTSYFRGEAQDACVSCHASVGHKDLSAHLPKGN